MRGEMRREVAACTRDEEMTRVTGRCTPCLLLSCKHGFIEDNTHQHACGTHRGSQPMDHTTEIEPSDVHGHVACDIWHVAYGMCMHLGIEACFPCSHTCHVMSHVSHVSLPFTHVMSHFGFTTSSISNRSLHLVTTVSAMRFTSECLKWRS